MTKIVVPSVVPNLRFGAHASPEEGACVMEYCAVLAGEEFTPHPDCVHRVIHGHMWNANDAILRYAEGEGAEYYTKAILARVPRLCETGDISLRSSLQVGSVNAAFGAVSRALSPWISFMDGAGRMEEFTTCGPNFRAMIDEMMVRLDAALDHIEMYRIAQEITKEFSEETTPEAVSA